MCVFTLLKYIIYNYFVSVNRSKCNIYCMTFYGTQQLIIQSLIIIVILNITLDENKYKYLIENEIMAKILFLNQITCN